MRSPCSVWLLMTENGIRGGLSMVISKSNCSLRWSGKKRPCYQVVIFHLHVELQWWIVLKVSRQSWVSCWFGCFQHVYNVPQEVHPEGNEKLHHHVLGYETLHKIEGITHDRWLDNPLHFILHPPPTVRNLTGNCLIVWELCLRRLFVDKEIQTQSSMPLAMELRSKTHCIVQKSRLMRNKRNAPPIKIPSEQ